MGSLNRCWRAKVLPGLTGSIFWAIRPSTSISVLPSWIRSKSLQILKASAKFTWYPYFRPPLSMGTPDMMAELKLCRMARAHISWTMYSYFFEWNAFRHNRYFRSRNEFSSFHLRWYSSLKSSKSNSCSGRFVMMFSKHPGESSNLTTRREMSYSPQGPSR